MGSNAAQSSVCQRYFPQRAIGSGQLDIYIHIYIYIYQIELYLLLNIYIYTHIIDTINHDSTDEEGSPGCHLGQRQSQVAAVRAAPAVAGQHSQKNIWWK